MDPEFSLAVGILGLLVGLFMSNRLKIKSPDGEWCAIGFGVMCFAVAEWIVPLLAWLLALALIPFLLWAFFTRCWPAVMRIIEGTVDGFDTFAAESGISLRDSRQGPDAMAATEQLRDRLIKLDRLIQDAETRSGVPEQARQSVLAKLREERSFVRDTMQTLVKGRPLPR